MATTSLTDSDIYDRIVSTILDHRLAPGTKLVEDRLATAFGVSRTRIRPVLVRLANEHIVSLTPNRGAMVAQPTVDEAREVFEVRRMIEPTLVERFIAQASADNIAVLVASLAEEETAQTQGDMHRAIRLSGNFHLHIAEHAGHQTLGRVLREMVSRTSLILMTYGPVARSERDAVAACNCREHRALLDAIRLRIAPEATRLMREHLNRIEAQLQFVPTQSAAPDLVQLFGQAA
jgi:DNA-binding GntR family transcriptional regulator